MAKASICLEPIQCPGQIDAVVPDGRASPIEHVDSRRGRLSAPKFGKCALISMPWAKHNMPSIQLAVLEHLLGQYNVECCKFEFYVDLCGLLKPENYKYLDKRLIPLAPVRSASCM